MEAELIIKLPDGTNKTILLKDLTYNTTYTVGGPADAPVLIGRIAVYGEIVESAPSPAV